MRMSDWSSDVCSADLSCGGAPHAAGSTTASNATQAPAMSFMRPFPLASHPHPPFRIDEATARIVDVLVEAAVLVGERRILVEQVVDAQAKVVLYAAIRVAEAEADEGIERQPAVDAEHVPVLVERRTGVVETADVVAAQAGVHALAIPVHAGNAAPLRPAVHLEIRDRRRIGVTLLLEGVHARVGRLEAEVAEARFGQLVGPADVEARPLAPRAGRERSGGGKSVRVSV